MTASINAANFLMLSTFGIAAVGYLLGRITIKGISLGTAGVFVIALVYGAFFGTHFNSRFVIEEINYASQALKIIENLGLVFFVTSVGFIAGPNFFHNLKRNAKSYVPLGAIIILIGVVVSILSFIAVIWAFIAHLAGNTVSGWASTVCIVCFMGGVQLICLGVIGEYIGKIYMETKHRPRYIISERTWEEEK